ncbi:MAG: glycerophosphodiester phosphodiesterase family protein [Thermodesulfobacteriota bacterium]
MRNILAIAHRGDSAHAPENTLAAFRAALDAGADMVECDVGLTRDLVPVILHDADLDRTSDGRGKLSAHSYDEMARLDAGSWFGPAFAGERIPTLEQALDLLAGRVQVNVEVKPEVLEQVSPERAAALVLDPVRRRGLLGSVVFSSFSAGVLDALRAAEPAARLGALADRPQAPEAAAARVRELAAESFNPDEAHLTPELAAAVHAAGALVLPWARRGRNTASAMRRALSLGADGFFADDPALLRRVAAGFRS